MDHEDRISSLPDGLLLDIISRVEIKIFICYFQKMEERLMSTKELIKTTSTISQRWQHFWTLLPNLIFIEYAEEGLGRRVHTKYFSFIDKTLTQCPTYVKLNKFKLHIMYDSKFVTILPSQVNSWIRHAITRNVQEVDLKIKDECSAKYDNKFSYDDELLFNNSCITSMRISNCLFNPPNGVVRWDKLKFLCISKGKLEGDIVGKMLFGSPCLETLELNTCHVVRCNFKSLFENFKVTQLTCFIEVYKRFSDDSYDDEHMSMKLSRCEFNPHINVVIRWEILKFLCISYDELDENLIKKIFSGSPCLETLELDKCYGVRRIDISSRRFKNLVLSNYGIMCPEADYIDTVEINAPYMLSLTIKDNLHLEKLLFLDISSLVKANFDYLINYRFADRRGRHEHDIREEMLRGLLQSLGHVNEITHGHFCFDDLSRLRDKGFQLFRVGADADEDRIPELFASGMKKRADEAAVAAATAATAALKRRVEKSKRNKNLEQMRTESRNCLLPLQPRQRQEKIVDNGESDDDMGLMSLFD